MRKETKLNHLFCQFRFFFFSRSHNAYAQNWWFICRHSAAVILSALEAVDELEKKHENHDINQSKENWRWKKNKNKKKSCNFFIKRNKVLWGLRKFMHLLIVVFYSYGLNIFKKKQIHRYCIRTKKNVDKHKKKKKNENL